MRSLPVQVIERSRTRLGLDWRELWSYRDLLYLLAARDIKVRYKQTLVGASWAVLQPLMTAALLTLVFGRLAGFEQTLGGVPYFIYVFAGFLPWSLFAGGIANGTQSILSGSALVTKVYFPRFILPLASLAVALVDFAVSSAALLAVMLYHGVGLSWSLLLCPVFALATLLAALGIGGCLSAVVAIYRDFRHVVPFVMQLWLFATPVIYPPAVVPPRLQGVLFLNPMAGVVEGFRAALFGGVFEWPALLLSLAVALLAFAAGTSCFRLMERRIADVI